MPYAHQIDEVLACEGRLENDYAPWPFLAEVTDRMQTGYEEQWRAEGRPLQFFAYRALEGNGQPLEGDARSLRGNARSLRGNARSLRGNAR